MAEFNKFQRSYRLDIETSTKEVLQIRPPLTLEFEVVRHNMASANTADFTIYNLNETSRKKLFKDRFDINAENFRAVQLYAGYSNSEGSMMPRIFNGDLRSAFSTRERTEYQTRLECYDGGTDLMVTRISKSFNKNTTKSDFIQALINQFPNIEKKFIASVVTDASKRGNIAHGNVGEILKELTNNKFYIDSRQAFILHDNEVIPGGVQFINSESGLLGTPRRSDKFIELDMIFEPRIQVGQMITIESTTEKTFNGKFKVTGVTHRGIISDSMSGECSTTLSLLAGDQFKVVW